MTENFKLYFQGIIFKHLVNGAFNTDFQFISKISDTQRGKVTLIKLFINFYLQYENQSITL